MNLLPKPQKIEIKDGFLRTKNVKIQNLCQDERIAKALKVFNVREDGANLIVKCENGSGEGYTLDIFEDEIVISGQSCAGAFYGIQTLRQIFENEEVPLLHIDDAPSMSFRGIYQDVTRGRVPTLETLKKLIDTIAYYKANSLQLYVEHAFPFKELGDAVEKLGYITPEEIKELDDYCYDRFIDFIPSLATFGHLYELLEREDYKHLQELDEYIVKDIRWIERMYHHTIDPENPESFEVIKSIIDQYMPLFRTDKFNICCDETFDLKKGRHKDKDAGRLYVEFVKKIIEYVKSKGKKVMMWGDIVLQHPEVIDDLPEDICLLHWFYNEQPKEEDFKTLRDSGRTQYVCPGTSSWLGFVEAMDKSTQNITNMLDLGNKYGAEGALTTNWGDCGDVCPLELALHGLILGASKSWNITTVPDEEFTKCINSLQFKNDRAVEYIKRLDEASRHVMWYYFAFCYSDCIYHTRHELLYTESHVQDPPKEQLIDCAKQCKQIIKELENEKWEIDIYRRALVICAEAVMMTADFYAKASGYDLEPNVDTEAWFEKYRELWLESSKESELYQIKEVIDYFNAIN